MSHNVALRRNLHDLFAGFGSIGNSFGQIQFQVGSD